MVCLDVRVDGPLPGTLHGAHLTVAAQPRCCMRATAAREGLVCLD